MKSIGCEREGHEKVCWIDGLRYLINVRFGRNVLIFHCKNCGFAKVAKIMLHIHIKWEVRGVGFIVKTDVKKRSMANSL